MLGGQRILRVLWQGTLAGGISREEGPGDSGGRTAGGRPGDGWRTPKDGASKVKRKHRSRRGVYVGRGLITSRSMHRTGAES